MNKSEISDLFTLEKFDIIGQMASEFDRTTKKKLRDQDKFFVFFALYELGKFDKAQLWAKLLLEKKMLDLDKKSFMRFMFLSACCNYEVRQIVQGLNLILVYLDATDDKEARILFDTWRKQAFERITRIIHWIGSVFILAKIILSWYDYEVFWVNAIAGLILLHAIIFLAFPNYLEKGYSLVFNVYRNLFMVKDYMYRR